MNAGNSIFGINKVKYILTFIKIYETNDFCSFVFFKFFSTLCAGA